MSLEPYRGTAARWLAASAMILALTSCQTPDPSVRSWQAAAKADSERSVYIPLTPEPLIGNPDSLPACVSAIAHHWIQPGWLDRRRLASSLDPFAPDTLGQPWVPLLRRYRMWLALLPLTEPEILVRLRAGAPVLLALPRDDESVPLRFAVAQGYDAQRGVFALWSGRGAVEEWSASELDALRQGTARMSALLCPVDAWGWALSPAEFRARALALEMLGETVRAESDYRQLLLLEPASAYPAWKLGNLMRSQGRPAEAEEHYRLAIARDDSDAVGYNNLAFLLAEQGRQLDEALRLARQAVYLNPRSARNLDTLGYVLYRRGAYEEAADVLERARGRARRLPPEEQAAIATHLALAQLGSQQRHLVRQVVSQIVRIFPSVQLPAELQPYHPHDQPVRR